MQSLFALTPELGAAGAFILAVVVSPQNDQALLTFGRDTLGVISNHWQTVLVIIRALGLGLVSAYGLGASMTDVVYTSRFLCFMTVLLVVMVVLTFAAARKSIVSSSMAIATAQNRSSLPPSS